MICYVFCYHLEIKVKIKFNYGNRQYISIKYLDWNWLCWEEKELSPNNYTIFTFMAITVNFYSKGLHIKDVCLISLLFDPFLPLVCSLSIVQWNLNLVSHQKVKFPYFVKFLVLFESIY